MRPAGRVLPLSLALALALAPHARASAPERPAPKQLRLWLLELDVSEPERVQAAIERLAASRHVLALDALSAFLREGQSDALTDHALAALGATSDPRALAVLAEFTRHRRVEARRQAYRAIAQIEDPGVNGVLAHGLRDSDAGVRGICARALGERRAAEALDLLFVALARGVPEAATALGQVVDAASVARVHAQLGRAPIETMLPAYDALLRRTDLDERVKLDVVGRLGEFPGPAVQALLRALLATADLRTQPRLRAALSDTASRMATSAEPARR